MTPALVLGGASCLWEDLAALEEIVGEPWPWAVVAVNDAIWAYPHPIHVAVSLHQDKVPGWLRQRREAGYLADGIEIWGGSWVTERDDSRLPWVDHVLPVAQNGSSGSHAIEVALFLGHPRVVGAGIPLDPTPHFDRPGAWESSLFHRQALERAAETWAGRVRFMSGWTADLFGRPTSAWLQNAPHRKAS